MSRDKISDVLVGSGKNLPNDLSGIVSLVEIFQSGDDGLMLKRKDEEA